MALIGKIRKHFWFVLILLGLALAAFVIMDAVSANNRGGLGAKQVVGAVAGNEIDLRDFQRTESTLFGGGSDQFASNNATWNYYVEKAIVDNQADELGVGVSGEELMELQFGPNYSPVIRNNFRNPQTGQLDQQQLLEFKQQIESGNELNPRFVNFWQEQQKQIVKTAKQGKINSLVSKSLYAPSFLVERTAKANSDRVNFDFIKVPFDYVDDVEVTDADITNYIAANKNKYMNDEETRILSYAVMNVVPTAEDSLEIRNELSRIGNEFKATTTDSIFAINNEGFYSPVYVSADNLTGSIKDNVTSMNVGDVYGPYLDQGGYYIAKLVDADVVPDSIEARHILISTGDNGVSLAEASSKIDSIQNAIKGGGSFSEIAKQLSDDPGSAIKGGELGTFSQGRMVKPFNDAVFFGSKVGGLYKVTTQFGVHLIKVEDKIYNDRNKKYKLAYIRSAIVPSQGTQDKLFDEVNDIVANNRTIAELKEAVAKNPKMTLLSSAPLKINDYLIGSLGGGQESRDAVKWAYGVNAGEVSPKVYTYTDQVNYYNNKYAIIGLEEIIPAGLPTASAARASVENLVLNQKRGDKIASGISSKDLNSLASTYGSTIETVDGAYVNKVNIPSLGTEPKVIATALSLEPNTVSAPIVGNNGVYVVKTTGKNTVNAAASIPQQRKTLSEAWRNRVSSGLLTALKKVFKAEDNRATYF